jgi:hypothetical protein
MTNETELAYLVIAILIMLVISFVLTNSGPRRR